MRRKKRVFNGKYYEFAGTVHIKTTANDVANKWRREGYLVRIVSEKTRWGNFTLYRRRR